jgi:hypothetical protein
LLHLVIEGIVRVGGGNNDAVGLDEPHVVRLVPLGKHYLAWREFLEVELSNDLLNAEVRRMELFLIIVEEELE